MAQKLSPKITDLGEFEVARVLPNPDKRLVGPFVFFDHMGPAKFSAGQGVNVRPHPHIGLATLTYLIEGQILHRDSLGNCQTIDPGDVNWMVAGKGITHSERETHEHHSQEHKLDGIQCWIALPPEHAEIEPSFTHVARQELPQFIKEGVSARLVVGDAYGMSSPDKTCSPMFLLDVMGEDGVELQRPNPEHECLAYVVTGCLKTSGPTGETLVESGQMALIDHQEAIVCKGFCRVLFLGGQAFNQTPHLFWNFVAFDKARIEQAKEDWSNGRFAPVVGDNEERIPLPS